MLELVEGKIQEPALPAQTTKDGISTEGFIQNPAHEQWVLRDQLALGWILSSVSDSIVTQLVGINHSYDAWATLERHYAQQNQARLLQLRTELHALKQGSSSMQKANTGQISFPVYFSEIHPGVQWWENEICRMRWSWRSEPVTMPALPPCIHV